MTQRYVLRHSISCYEVFDTHAARPVIVYSYHKELERGQAYNKAKYHVESLNKANDGRES